MLRSTISWLLAGVLSLVCWVPLASAQPTGPLVQPSMPGGGQPAPATAVPVLDEAFLAVLRGLDPNLQVRQIQNATQYHVAFARDGWNYQITVEAYAGRIWLLCPLGNRIPSVQQLSADLLGRMLVLNDKIGPTHFSYRQTDNGSQLYLNHSLDRTISPERLQAGLNEFLRDIRESYAVWSTATAGAPPVGQQGGMVTR